MQASDLSQGTANFFLFCDGILHLPLEQSDMFSPTILRNWDEI